MEQHVGSGSRILPIASFAVILMQSQAERALSVSRKSIRLIVLINFMLFALFVVPLTNRWIDQGLLALKSLDLEDLVGHSLQIWLAGSTVVATTLFGSILWKQRRAVSEDVATSSLKYEGIMLLAWWLVVLGACAYGYMLGMGG